MGNGKSSGGLVWFIVLLVLAGLGGGAWWYVKNKESGQPEFTTAKVSRGDVVQAVTATGTLNPVLKVQVGSQISGIIQSLYADFNSVVKSNQVIAQLDPATYKANLSSAEGDLANARASLELAQVNAKRAADLFKGGLISQADHDQSVATLHQAEAQVQIRTASVERARVDLGRCTIYAPVDGTVISRDVDVGQTVAASMSAPVLFQIASDLTKMQINANVAEADVGGVEVGQEVEFTVDAFPTRTFSGRVTQVRNSPLTVQNVVTYDTIINVDNSDLKLKPGMTANVSIIAQRREGALRIPNSALRFRPDESWVIPIPTTHPAAVSENDSATTSTNAMAGAGTGRRRGGFGGPGGSGDAGGFGGRGEGGGRNRFGRSGGERRLTQTLYTLSTTNKADGPVLKPVRVRLGITDGIFTEVIDGLTESEPIVTSANVASSGDAAGGPNPFGGRGFRRF